MTAERKFAGTAQDAEGKPVYDQHGELLRSGYTDTSGEAGPQVLTVSANGDGKSGLIKTSGLASIILSFKNNEADLTWDTIPSFRGTNDPLIVNPTVTDGFDLDVGKGEAVNKAFGVVIAKDEEQCVVIDCSKAPNGIFLIGDPPRVKLDLDIFVKLNRK